MTVKRTAAGSRLELNQDAPENSCRPAVDVLFRSVAEIYGESVLGVVMTGMGSDGVHGAQRIRERGGEVIIQDEASSVVWGMPLGACRGPGGCGLSARAVEPGITRRVVESRSPAAAPTQSQSLILERSK